MGACLKQGITNLRPMIKEEVILWTIGILVDLGVPKFETTHDNPIQT